MLKFLQHLLVLVLLIFFSSSIFAQTGKISGKVIDKANGDMLPGANLIFKEHNIGAATDFDGKFLITNIPVGKQKLTVSYIGYEPKEVILTIVKNRVLAIDIELAHKTITGKTVVVTGQASAQTQALNQQISSRTIKNIVSSKSIQELPESNAAEAVGRLPGVSLERSGGEGAKVIIRGLAPKYTKVQIDGVSMAATGEGDRSSDLSMISPYMLEGIEVTKSIQADQEADATGGIVNFRIKTAPEKPTFNAVVQGGHTSLANDYGNYKASVGGSSRFWDNKLGIYAQFNLEKKNNSSDEMGDRKNGVNFYKQKTEDPIQTLGFTFIDANRIIDRIGATIVMDYSLPTTKIKFSNFSSKIEQNRQDYKLNYQFNPFLNSYGPNLVDHFSNLTIMTNSLKINQYFNNFEIDAGVSYVFSENEVPEELKLSVGWLSDRLPFGDIDIEDTYYLNPYTIPDSLKVLDLPTSVAELRHEESFTKENELGFDFNLTYKNIISKNIGLKIKVGAKYKHKNKLYNKNVRAENINQGGAQFFRNMIIDEYWDELSETNRNVRGRPGSLWFFPDFIDPDYSNNEFLGGKFTMDRMPNLEWFRNIDNIAIEKELYHNYGIPSLKDDYNGTEDYWAVYVKPEIQIGNDLTIIPGLRYENNETEYTGYRIDESSIVNYWDPFVADTTTTQRKNSFLLPMVQFFYQPLNWINIKGGFTKTLQRPNYEDIIPFWNITRFNIFWKNFRLRPEKSTNFDLQVSLFSDKIGLLSIGAFHKKIEDMMFWTGNKSIIDTAFFGLPSNLRYRTTAFVINNENDAFDYGIELEWKSNFWWLPGLLNGLVINVNYTRNFSEAKYLRTRITSEYFPVYKAINNDTTYTNPMILQPDHLLNLTVGYDYEGFSIRWAFRYKSNIFKFSNWHSDLRGYSTDFLRHDLSIKQQLPFKGLELYLNINNLTNEFERDEIRPIGHTNLTRHEEHYGRFTTIGLRFRY